MILRPLVGTNKQEIIDAAQHIGSFELSKVVGEYCDLVPHKPATGASFAAIDAEESRMDPEVLVQAVSRARDFDLRHLPKGELEIPELEVGSIPPGATVIDLRSRAEYQSWHHEGALWLDFQRALASYPSFETGRSYVLYCEYSDDLVFIEPDEQPGWQVKVFHIDGFQVAPGQRVEAGVTVLAPRATVLPFESQVDELTAEPSWPHVHIEVIDPSIPDRPSEGGGC